MNAFMTNGTLDFLEKRTERHQQITFHLMTNFSNSLAYYEGDDIRIFQSGREYEILIKSGNIAEKGYVVMNNIPLTEEGTPIFLYRFKQRQDDISSMPGFQAFRLLKPVQGNVYVVFTQWASEDDFEAWKESEEFILSHQNNAVKPPAYFASRPFITYYSMGDDGEDVD